MADLVDRHVYKLFRLVSSSNVHLVIVTRRDCDNHDAVEAGGELFLQRLSLGGVSVIGY
jgi:hypothetical protein